MQPRHSIAGPILLIAVGFVFLLNTLRPGYPIADWLFNYWPYLLMLWGTLQLLEVLIRFGSKRPVPVNGVSAGGWFVVLLIALVGFGGFHARHVWNWNHGPGPFFMRGVKAFGREHEFSVMTQQKAVGAAPRIIIENFRGDAKISADASRAIVLSGRKLISSLTDELASQANQGSPVELITRGDTVVVRCHQENLNGQVRVTTNLELTVPRDSSVEATGTQGDFDISGLHGNVDVSSENAGVRLQDIEGSVKIDTRTGDIVRCSAIKGSVDVRGHGDDLELTRISGPVTIAGAFTGRVTLRALEQQVHVVNMRTEFTLKQVPGEVRMERGEIGMEDVAGPVHLNTRATDVKLEKFTNGLDMTVDKGDVELRPVHLPLGPMAVRTRSGNIEMDLPQTAGCALRALTNHGEISNEFSGAFQQTNTGQGAELHGAIGSANGPEVHLETNRGSINIRKGGETVAKANADPSDDQ